MSAPAAAPLSIPSVTVVGQKISLHRLSFTQSTHQAQDDLQSFFLAHFVSASTDSTAASCEPTIEVTDEPVDEDALGYYADGTKRTLTDEQIAMFRHSEIQALVRARRYRQEAGEPEPRSEDDDCVDSAVASLGGTFLTAETKRKDGSGKGEGSAGSRDTKKKKKNKTRQKWPARQWNGGGEGMGKTSRRLAREEDVMGEAPMQLDYE